MKRFASFILVASFVLAPVARAAEVVPLEAGQVAPSSGLLVPAETFEKYINAQTERDALKDKIVEREKAIKDAEYRAARSWFEQHGLIIGLVAGAIVGGVVAWKVHDLVGGK